MADDFVGSHLKTFTGPGAKSNATGYGQNGSSQGPLHPGETKPNIPGVSPPTPTVANANAKDDDARLAQITGHPVKAHDHFAPRSVDSGSPGGPVPSANVRRSRTDGVGRPTK